MSLNDLNDPNSVRKALAEYKEIGQAEFLNKYGFGKSRDYFIRFKGETFDSKAIVGAAHGYQTGTPLTAKDFSGGERTVKKKLEKLGFEIRSVGVSLDAAPNTKGDIRNLFLELAEGWPSYYQGKKTDKTNPTHKIITKALPDCLKNLSPDTGVLQFHGSAGQGNLTPAPWIAVFHTEITTTAREEFYIVYLFSLDLSSLVLEIGLGVTQFENRYGRNEKMLGECSAAADVIRASADILKEKALSQTVQSRLNIGPINLLAGMQSRLHQAYERCAIYYLQYDMQNLPAISSLEHDYKEFLSLYVSMADSIIVPSVSDLSWDSASPNKLETEIELTNFLPLVRKNKTSKVVNKNTPITRRNSRKAHKVGLEAEQFVFEYEKKKLIELELLELADQVIWHRDYAKDRTPGWDITSYLNNGKKTLIVVKGTEGKSISSLNLTVKEWNKARDANLREYYYIYLVYNALTKPKIQVIHNPAEWVERGRLEFQPSEFELSLYDNAQQKLSFS